MASYYDLNYSKFLTKSLLVSERGSPLETQQNLGVGSVGAISMATQINPITDISFSSSDNDTAAWSAGTIYFANGSNSGNIVAGNTGNISAKTYIYYDGDKPGSLLTTTDISRVPGGRRMLVAIAEAGEAGKACKITPIISTGMSMNITTGQIVADAITSTEINVTQLDAVAANTGTLTVDETISVGTASGSAVVTVDGVNKRIIVNDGTNDRILIGYQLNGF